MDSGLLAALGPGMTRANTYLTRPLRVTDADRTSRTIPAAAIAGRARPAWRRSFATSRPGRGRPAWRAGDQDRHRPRSSPAPYFRTRSPPAPPPWRGRAHRG